MPLLLIGAALFMAPARGQEHRDASEERWQPPKRILCAAERHEGTAVVAANGCRKPKRLRRGTRALKRFVSTRWPEHVESFTGYECRRIIGGSDWSVHATGRALDIHIPQEGETGANNRLGDPIANHLLEHAAELGIQRIIWDCSIWSAYERRARFSAYCTSPGRHPHYDHIHVELSPRGARKKRTAFTEPVGGTNE